MKKTTIIEKKATLEILEDLFERLDYFERDAQGYIKGYTEELENMEEPDRQGNWRLNEIEKLNIKLKAIEKIQTALEKLI